MSRFTNKQYKWLALVVTVGVTIIPGAAQALPLSYDYYRGGFGTDATRTHTGIQVESGWAQAGAYSNTLGIVDETGTIVNRLFHGDAGVIHLDESNLSVDGPALVSPSHHNFAAGGESQNGDVGECDPTGAVPEPETLVLVSLGLLGIAGLARAQG